jgi:hypothetical protein
VRPAAQAARRGPVRDAVAAAREACLRVSHLVAGATVEWLVRSAVAADRKASNADHDRPQAAASGDETGGDEAAVPGLCWLSVPLVAAGMLCWARAHRDAAFTM